MSRLLKIHERDNVCVAIDGAPAGARIDGIVLKSDVPAGHKVAVTPIRRGDPVLKYGYPIGRASREIAVGEHVHTHNVESALPPNLADLSFHPRSSSNSLDSRPVHGEHFDGYRRADGRVATRNEIWIVNTVGCVNHASERIAAAAHAALPPGGPVEGVFAFPHPFGCSQLGDDLRNTQRVLAGLVHHPNAAAVLVLGLGCENNQIKAFLEEVGTTAPGRVKYFNAQEVTDEVEAGIKAVSALVEYAAQFKREPMPLAELMPGMKCGGSDGYSGITANPLVGRVADRLCEMGATTLLSEVPEMFGAEQVLLERAADAVTFSATIELVNRFRDYFRKYDQPIDENPSPGNKDGGITTLAEKSLGCVQKGGTRAPVRQVLDYGARAQPGLGGLALVNAPGNDGVSSTAMTIAGAQVLLFTTGRGTPMGFPAPTIKIATNSNLARRKPQWIDFDAGVLAAEGASMEQTADRLLSLVIDVASGRTRTRNEQHGYREIAIWKNGVTL